LKLTLGAAMDLYHPVFPPNLMQLFKPREPLAYLPPSDKLPVDKKYPPITGIAAFVKHFEDPQDTPAAKQIETREEIRARKRQAKMARAQAQLEEKKKEWDPALLQDGTGDPYKTLFVARINFDTTESKLQREYEQFGPIVKVRLVQDTVGKPRGYAFIEYEHERDMRTAYKQGDGMKIDGRRVLVDVERGRTVKDWNPRRLGGGLGSTRRGGDEVNMRNSGRDGDRQPQGSIAGDSRSGSRDRYRSSDRDRDRDRDYYRSSRSDRGTDRGDRYRGREPRDDRSRGQYWDMDNPDRERDYRPRDRDYRGGRDDDRRRSRY